MAPPIESTTAATANSNNTNQPSVAINNPTQAQNGQAQNQTQLPTNGQPNPTGATGQPQPQQKTVLSIRAVKAHNLRGSKGEKLNSMVRVQFADFEHHDSEVVSDTPDPEYNFSWDLDLHTVDDKLIDTFINKKLSFTIIEMLPKEKTAVIGAAEISLYHPFISSYGKENEIRRTVNVMFGNGAGGVGGNASGTGAGQGGSGAAAGAGSSNAKQMGGNAGAGNQAGVNNPLLPTGGSSGPNPGNAGGANPNQPITGGQSATADGTGNSANLPTANAQPGGQANSSGGGSGAAGNASNNAAGNNAGPINSNVPCLEIEVRLSNPLLPVDQMEAGNLMTLYVEDMFPVPDEWLTKEFAGPITAATVAASASQNATGGAAGNASQPSQPGQSGGNAAAVSLNNAAAGASSSATSPEKEILNFNLFTYSLNFLIPAGAGSNNRIVSIRNGVLKGIDNNILGSEGAGGNNANNSNLGSTVAVNERDSGSSLPKKFVEWRQAVKFWINPEAAAKIRERLTRKKPFVVELVRELLPKYASQLQDTLVNKYRGRIHIDASSLLFPKITNLKGRFQIEHFDMPITLDSEEDRKRTTNAGAPVAVTNNAASSNAGALLKKGATISNRPGTGGASHHLGVSGGGGAGGFSGDVYKANGSSVYLEIVLDKPLLDKKKLQTLNKTVRDFIPARGGNPEFTQRKRAARALHGYEQKVMFVLDRLATEYYLLYQKEASFSTSSNSTAAPSGNAAAAAVDFEGLRKKLLFVLNESGQYYQFKEQLKMSVTEIVREHFNRKSPFTSKSEMKQFLNEVYVYLVDQMHSILNRNFVSAFQSGDHSSGANNEENTGANSNNLINNSNNNGPNNNNNGNNSNLISVGANTTTSSVFNYDINHLRELAEESESELLMDMANMYHLERISKAEDSVSVWFDYATFCMRNNWAEKAEQCYKLILGMNDKHVPTLLAYGVYTCQREKFEEAHVYFRSAVDTSPQDVLSLTLLGYYYAFVDEMLESEHVLEAAQKLFSSSNSSNANNANNANNSISSVRFLAIDFLISIQADSFAEKVIAQELGSSGSSTTVTGSSSSNTAKAYLLLSKLYLQRRALELAEEYARKAIDMDGEDADAWAMLGHVLYFKKQYAESQVSYEKSLSLGSSSANSTSSTSSSTSTSSKLVSVFLHLGYIYLRPELMPDYHAAKSNFLKSCELRQSALAWLGVGIACLKLGQYAVSEDSFSEAITLNNRKGKIWAYLALLCLETNRPFEANQALRQALRCGVDDATVLRELGSAYLLKANSPAEACESLRLSLTWEDLPETRELLAQAMAQLSQKVAGRAAASSSSGAPSTSSTSNINTSGGGAKNAHHSRQGSSDIPGSKEVAATAIGGLVGNATNTLNNLPANEQQLNSSNINNNNSNNGSNVNPSTNNPGNPVNSNNNNPSVVKKLANAGGTSSRPGSNPTVKAVRLAAGPKGGAMMGGK